MIQKIWRILTQILCYNNNSIDLIKPFFENLNNENINNGKYIPFLQTFSQYQLEVLLQNKIITNETFNLSKPKLKTYYEKGIIENQNEKIIDAIISGDKIQELRDLIQEKGITQFNIIQKQFNEATCMKIPIIQYCVMKNALECFKYLLVNGYDDPNKPMEDQNPIKYHDYVDHENKQILRYQWDCMAIAIYFGNKEIIKILEGKGIKKSSKPIFIEAAILSYRNKIVKEILEELNDHKEHMNDFLAVGIRTSTKNNNIKGAELMIKNGANINSSDALF